MILLIKWFYEMNLIAIDPGTKSLGIAYFDNGILKDTFTLTSYGNDRQGRQVEIMQQMALTLGQIPFDGAGPFRIVCEEPMLMGKSNNAMQRMLGALEWEFHAVGGLEYISPMSVKMHMGSGKLDKFEVALAAGALLTTDEEQEMMASLISNEAWDATDAVAIGLCFIKELHK